MGSSFLLEHGDEVALFLHYCWTYNSQYLVSLVSEELGSFCEEYFHLRNSELDTLLQLEQDRPLFSS